MSSTRRPNIVFVLADDHAAQAISAYGSRINRTPHLDRLAAEGARLDTCCCTNSICTPSRAAILTGTYNHVNGVTTLSTPMDNRLPTFVTHLREAGYQTAVFGKWHLGEGPAHCPSGFDDWAVLPGQGYYHNPDFIFAGPDGGTTRTLRGYVTNLVTDLSLDWLERRDPTRPFCLLCHHKAPHRPWDPDEKHAAMHLGETVPEPETLQDDHRNRAAAAAAATMRVGVHMNERDLKAEINRSLPEHELRSWAYQRYIKDYLRVVASIDDNVGRLLARLDAAGLTDDTIFIYTSDQGFFLGEHGWFDKRFMYEESLRMPCLVRYPREIAPGATSAALAANVDFAPTLLDYAGLPVPAAMQGASWRPLLASGGAAPAGWRDAVYYRYWMHQTHHGVAAHYGIRTDRHKLIHYYGEALGQPGALDEPTPPEWELFDLADDPRELRNRYEDPGYAGVRAGLTRRLHDLQAGLGDRPVEA